MLFNPVCCLILPVCCFSRNICTDTKDRNADLHLPVETRTWNETQLLARARKAKIDGIYCKRYLSLQGVEQTHEISNWKIEDRSLLDKLYYCRQLDSNRKFDGKSYTFQEMLKGKLRFDRVLCMDTKDRNAHLDMPMKHFTWHQQLTFWGHMTEKPKTIRQSERIARFI